MRINTTSLMLILGLSLVASPLTAQEAAEDTGEDAIEETPDNNNQENEDSSDQVADDEITEEGEESDDSSEDTKDEDQADENEAEEVVEKTWQDRLIPSVAISGLEPAPEVIVGEPSASSKENSGDKIYLPYPPRPCSPLPPGWVLRPSNDLPPITRNVRLADGRRAILEFPTMELQPTPVQDGSVSMQEPGFDPRKPEQENTISKALTAFIDDTTAHRDVLGEALREMEQILLSAPAAPRRAEPVSNNSEPSSPLLPPSPPR